MRGCCVGPRRWVGGAPGIPRCACGWTGGNCRHAGPATSLPPGAERLRLVSRSLVPQEHDGSNPDRRRLGVAVSGLLFDGVPAGAHAYGPGFHAPEPGWRWTDGDGWVAVPFGARMMSVQLVPIETYQARDVAASPGEDFVTIQPVAVAG